MRKLLNKRLADADAEAVRRSHAGAIQEQQDLPASSLRVISGVVLPDAVGVQVSHKLRRRPLAFWVSPVRGSDSAGSIEDLGTITATGRPNDLTQTLSLRASGYGGDIVVDIMVM